LKITRDEARRIATLAHLEFDDDSLDRLAGEMTKILGYVESLPPSPGPSGHPLPHAGEGTVLREDLVTPSLDRHLVAENAPSFDDGFFVVPKVIDS
jgi:aspartyl-tRNA(Asn)/glutamyl-tRNA(Gln) amidotransferase subunit C